MPLHPTLALILYGALTGAAVMVVFKITSRPARVLAARNRALSRILELWLFRHDPWLAFRSLGSMVTDCFRYLHSLVIPLFASLIPAIFLLWLAHERFAFRPPAPGESVMLIARAAGAAPDSVFENIPMPPGLLPTASPVVAWGEAAWELSAAGPTQIRALRAWQRRPRAPIARLELRLPSAQYNLLGWHTSWLWVLLVSSLVAGLILKRPLRVEF